MAEKKYHIGSQSARWPRFSGRKQARNIVYPRQVGYGRGIHVGLALTGTLAVFYSSSTLRVP